MTKIQCVYVELGFPFLFEAFYKIDDIFHGYGWYIIAESST